MTDSTVIIRGVCQRVTRARNISDSMTDYRPFGPALVEVEPCERCACCMRLVQPTPAQRKYCAEACDRE